MTEKEQSHIEYGATLESLFQAYFDCRKNKRNTINPLRFETDYEYNLIALCDELNSNTWHPGRSIAFIINKPVKRQRQLNLTRHKTGLLDEF